MIQVLYKALGDGLAKLVRNGLAFTVMTGVIIGLVWVCVWLVQTHERDRIEWKSELLAVKEEYSGEINKLRIEIFECQNNNSALMVQVAELKARLDLKR